MFFDLQQGNLFRLDDEALLDTRFARPGVSMCLALHEYQLWFPCTVPAQTQSDRSGHAQSFGSKGIMPD